VRIVRKIGHIVKSYEPINYWTKQGKNYLKEFVYSEQVLKEQEYHIDYLKSLSFETVLEFGCGFGRLTKLVLENFPIKKYKAFDISPTLISDAKKFCENFDNVSFEVSSIQDFQSDEKYDLVFGYTVLMHVVPKEIRLAMKNLVRLANNDVINFDWYQKHFPLIIAKHNFLHSYKEIYESFEEVNSITVSSTPSKKVKAYHAKIA